MLSNMIQDSRKTDKASGIRSPSKDEPPTSQVSRASEKTREMRMTETRQRQISCG